MRILITGLFISVWFLCFAGSRPADPPPATEAAVTEALTETASLSALEAYVTTKAVTAEEVAAQRPDLLEGLNLTSDTNPVQTLKQQDGPLGIPSFLWGCVLGGIGIALVYILSDKDEAEAKKALNGCVLAYGLGAAIWLVTLVMTTSLQ